MPNLFIRETFVNASENYSYGDSDIYETFTDDKGELYRFLVKEYGRCISKVYRDTPEGTKAIGWVFVKRARYDDARSEKDTYLEETWVTLHEAPPTKTIEYHFATV